MKCEMCERVYESVCLFLFLTLSVFVSDLRFMLSVLCLKECDKKKQKKKRAWVLLKVKAKKN